MEDLRVLGCLLILSAFGRAQSPTAISFTGLQESNPTATFDHGYVAGWDLQHMHGVTIYAPDGQRLFEVSSFKLSDGTITNAPLSVAIDSDGTSALVYWAAYGMRSGIVIVDKTGYQNHVIETEPYKPSQVCFAPDHSLWIFGDQWRAVDLPVPDFMTFRHYSRDGKLLGSFVPRSVLPDWQGAGLDQAVAPFVGLWRLRAANDRIGAALLVGPWTQAWVELNLDGELIGQWTYIETRHEAVVPSAFDSSGVLYGVRWIDNKRAGIAVFDKSTGNWKPVPSLPNGHLVGADGTRLVYQSGDQLQWVSGLNKEPAESVAITQP